MVAGRFALEVRLNMQASSLPSPVWKVPYRRNPFFTGGEEILHLLRRELQKQQAAALSQPQGISGLGGIGKTQIAIEYAYRYATDYQTVLWAQAESALTLTSEFVAIAHRLGLPERNEQDQRVIVEAVLRWFRRFANWLLILDNVDNLAAIEPLVPKAARGHILFTTRAHSLGNIAHRIEVRKMEQDVGALLLLRRSALLALQTPLTIARREDQILAREISQLLGGLPLALNQAGAYIKETPCALEQYLEFYQTRYQDLLHVRPHSEEEYPASVATTWSLSFEKVTRANPAAAELLDLCAFLAPDAIPEDMITGGASHVGPQLQHVVTNPVLFDQSIAALLAYSLIARNADDGTLSIHRLVQAVLQDTLEETERRTRAERAVLAVNATFPESKHETWPRCEQLLPHALRAAQLSKTYQISQARVGRLLHETASYLYDRARYQEAGPLYQRALMIREQQVGPQHLDTAHTLNDLARLYAEQGEYKQAEPLYQRALAIWEQQEGPQHPDVAIGLNNLAELYKKQGKYKLAESFYQRALAILEQSKHPNAAMVLNNLGEFYKKQGKYKLAESFYQQALTIWEQQAGPQHPDVAIGLNNLAEVYRLQKKYEQAEPVYRRALAILEPHLGDEHLYTAAVWTNLALLHAEREEYEQAEPLLVRALKIFEQHLGTEHPNTGAMLNDLAELYCLWGKYEQAEPLLVRALKIFEQHLGAEHPHTASSLNNLASLYKEQGKYRDAESLYQRTLAIREQQLGTDHPETKDTRKKYALLLCAMGRDTEAAALDPDGEFSP